MDNINTDLDRDRQIQILQRKRERETDTDADVDIDVDADADVHTDIFLHSVWQAWVCKYHHWGNSVMFITVWLKDEPNWLINILFLNRVFTDGATQSV